MTHNEQDWIYSFTSLTMVGHPYVWDTKDCVVDIPRPHEGELWAQVMILSRRFVGRFVFPGGQVEQHPATAVVRAPLKDPFQIASRLVPVFGMMLKYCLFVGLYK